MKKRSAVATPQGQAKQGDRPLFSDVITRLKPAKIGIAEIVHDTPSSLDRLHGVMRGQPLMRDKYCRLIVNGVCLMTDAEFERRTNTMPVFKAKGCALIGGLGMGLVLDGFLARCSSVTVIEKSREVIDLVGKSFPEVTVIHADIFEWQPNGQRFDTIYFDIWPAICTDDLAEARKLHRKFKPYLREGGYMESWCRIALKYIR